MRKQGRFLTLTAGTWCVYLLLSNSLPAQPIYDFPPLSVNGLEWGEALTEKDLRLLPMAQATEQELSLARILDSIPGVNFQRRGFGSLEPNIRGFALDRLTTTFNGHYLPIAAPTRTASPVNFMGPSFPGSVDVIKGFSPVRMGPVPTGGRIVVDTFPDFSPRPSLLLTGTLNPDGGIAAVCGNPLAANPYADLNISAYMADAGSYKSGDGLYSVDEAYAAAGATVALSLRPWQQSIFEIATNYHSQQKANNPSLPLDSDGAEAFFVTGRWIQQLTDGQIMLRFGCARISQALSSDRREILFTAPIARIHSQADGESLSTACEYTFRVTVDVSVHAGFDYTYQSRDAIRSRYLKSGPVLADLIWPGIEVRQPGLYIEAESLANSSFDWRLGIRFENTRQAATRIDAPVAGVAGAQGPTIADNFAQFNGFDPGQPGQEFWTGSLQAVVRKSFSNAFELTAAAGYTVAPPGPGESYRAFLDALGGGVELGNPELDTEKNRSLSLGIQYESGMIRSSIQGWIARIDDFISRAVIVENPLIYSFRNRDVRFHGIEASLYISPFTSGSLESLILKLSLSGTSGEHRTSGQGIAEVPPRNGLLSISWNSMFQDGPISIILDIHHASARKNPQPSLNPVFRDSESYDRLDLAVHWQIRQELILSLLVENLLDSLAYDYLQPPVTTGPVLPSGGNLLPGERIPLAGISVRFGIRWNF